MKEKNKTHPTEIATIIFESSEKRIVVTHLYKKASWGSVLTVKYSGRLMIKTLSKLNI